LLLAYLIMRFLQITAELLADFGGQRRHHHQQNQHHQQGDALLLTDSVHGLVSGEGAGAASGVVAGASAAFSGAAAAATSGISPGVLNTQRQASPFSIVNVTSTPSGRWAASCQAVCQP